MEATGTTLESLLQVGIVAAKGGQKTLAKNIFRRITRENPSHDVAWFWHASISDSLQVRLSYLIKALQLNPENPVAEELLAVTKAQFVQALIDQGTSAVRNGMPEQAPQFLLHAAELDPTNECVWAALAELEEQPEELPEVAEPAQEYTEPLIEVAIEEPAMEVVIEEPIALTLEPVFELEESAPVEIEIAPLPVEEPANCPPFEGGQREAQGVFEKLEIELPSPELPPTALLTQNPSYQPPDNPPLMPEASIEEPPAHLPTLTLETEATPPADPAPAAERKRDSAQHKDNESEPAFAPFTNCPLCEQQLEAGCDQCLRCGGQIVLKNFLTPSNVPGKIKFDRRRSLLAVARFGQALTKDPENAQIHYNLGFAYLNLNSFDVAMRSLRRAEQLRPDAALAAMILELVNAQSQPAVNEPAAAGQSSPGSSAVAGKDQGPEKERPAPGQKSIMVVDDSPTIRKLVAHTLGKSGYRVIQAVDGNDALTKVGEERIDLVFMDIVMPNLDGYQVCKLIREKKNDLPVVMLSGKDGFFDKMRGKVAGSTAHITKPFDADTLIQAAKKYCAA
jgi:CheY-like chemotaxis protein